MATPGAGSGPGKYTLPLANTIRLIQIQKLEEKDIAKYWLGELAKLGIKPPYPETVKTKADYEFEIVRAGLIAKNASKKAAEEMGEYYKKKMENIKKMEENAAKNAAAKGFTSQNVENIESFLAENNSPKELTSQNIEAFLAEPTSSSAHEKYLKNIQRALNNAAVATRKNTKLAALQERMRETEAKLAPQLGMKTGLPQSNYMNRIANTLGKPRGLPPAVYLKALRNKYRVPAGMTLRAFKGQTRKAGGKRKNKNRKTRRRV
jgi:DNA-binding ferritin-like protein (Dps family)